MKAIKHNVGMYVWVYHIITYSFYDYMVNMYI